MVCVSIFSSDTMWILEEDNSPRESEEEDEERKRGKTLKFEILYILLLFRYTQNTNASYI